jgi:hypothetical protein
MNDWILRLLSNPSLNKPMEGKWRWIVIVLVILLVIAALLLNMAVRAWLGILPAEISN